VQLIVDRADAADRRPTAAPSASIGEAGGGGDHLAGLATAIISPASSSWRALRMRWATCSA
jgi:hypothetical protein